MLKKFLKWFFIIWVGIAALLLGSILIISLINRHIPINQSTKTCLITGVSSGIGREMAREMVKRGWTVIGIARRKEKLKELEQELGGTFIAYICNVGVSQQIHLISNAIKKRNLKPTLFFLNAGTGTNEIKFQPILADHKQMFVTNYFGVIAWVDEWLNDVKSHGGGTFVATSSVAALFSGPGAGGYGATKAALNTCFRSLRWQYCNNDIGFVIVMPGPVQTALLKTDKPMLFTHQPDAEARYIIDRVFKGESTIEPSWIYAWALRILNALPESTAMLIINGYNCARTEEYVLKL